MQSRRYAHFINRRRVCRFFGARGAACSPLLSGHCLLRRRFAPPRAAFPQKCIRSALLIGALNFSGHWAGRRGYIPLGATFPNPISINGARKDAVGALAALSPYGPAPSVYFGRGRGYIIFFARRRTSLALFRLLTLIEDRVAH